MSQFQGSHDNCLSFSLVRILECECRILCGYMQASSIMVNQSKLEYNSVRLQGRVEFVWVITNYLPWLGCFRSQDGHGKWVCHTPCIPRSWKIRFSKIPWERPVLGHRLHTQLGWDKYSNSVCPVWETVQTTMCMTSGEYLGQIRKQNKNFMPAIIHAVNKVGKDIWETSLDIREHKCIEALTANDIMKFCDSFCVKEVLHVFFPGMLPSWEETTAAQLPFIVFLHERLKAEKESCWHWHSMLIVWVLRRIFLEEGHEIGLLLQDPGGRQGRIIYYDLWPLKLFEKVKTNAPGVTCVEIRIEDFSLWCSRWRKTNTEAHNQWLWLLSLIWYNAGIEEKLSRRIMEKCSSNNAEI